jgi:hypothetical protein
MVLTCFVFLLYVISTERGIQIFCRIKGKRCFQFFYDILLNQIYKKSTWGNKSLFTISIDINMILFNEG